MTAPPMPDLLAVVERLTATIAAENTQLSRMSLQEVAGFADLKTGLLQAYEHHLLAIRRHGISAAPETSHELALRLAELKEASAVNLRRNRAARQVVERMMKHVAQGLTGPRSGPGAPISSVVIDRRF